MKAVRPWGQVTVVPSSAKAVEASTRKGEDRDVLGSASNSDAGITKRNARRGERRVIPGRGAASWETYLRPWFEGEGTLACDVETVATALENPGQFFVGTVGLMPGISEAKLVEEGDGFVTIRTNEGLMKRTGISVHRDPAIRIEFDEVYEAGSLVAVTSHYEQEFVPVDGGVRHRLVINVLEAPGLLGLAYRWLASGNIGRAVLEAHRQRFEEGGD